MIILTVNGESRTFDDGATIESMLKALDIDKRRVAVAVNGEVIPRNDHGKTPLHDNDQVEVVRMVGGGSLEAGSSKLEGGTRDKADIIVVGAGIVGCAIAYELSRKGVSCIVLDSRLLGMAATNAAAGILAPLAEFQRPGELVNFGLEGLKRYPVWVERLADEAPDIDVEFQLNGVLRVAFAEDEMQELRKGLRYKDEVGLELVELGSDELREVEPRLNREAIGGVLCLDEGQVSNQLFTLALSRAAKARGARFYERTPVTGFRRSEGRVTSVRTAAGEFAGDHVALATGPWVRPLAAMLGVEVPTRPIRGQMIALGGMRAPIHHVVWGPHGYVLPRANGLVFAGATVEDVGFRFGTTKRGLAQVRRGAFELVPQLRQAREHFSWFGLRPGSPDGLPMIGPLPGYENVTVAAGHFRNGILLAPITGELVADEITSGRPNGQLAPFRLDRFG